MTDKMRYSTRNSSKNTMIGPIPDPPVFSVKSVKFTVPPYFGYEHPETQWLLNMVRTNSWERLWRVAINNPDYFNQTYIQYPDCPDVGCPMFHKRAVLYLTPLGLAVYMNQSSLVNRMLNFKTENNQPLISPNQQLYATNIYERDANCSDLHVIFPFCILFRRESFDCISAFLNAGWNAHEGFVLPYRRSYRMFSFEYKDFLDYCIAQMSSRPILRLPNLITNMLSSNTDNFSLMEFERVLCSHNKAIIEDWVSLPRRMLRFLYYFDKDLRLACQIIRCIRVFIKHMFFHGPCESSFDIIFQLRKAVPDPTNRKSMVMYDQDNVIALLLALFYRALGLRHSQTQEKLIDILTDICVYTRWALHFIVVNPNNLSGYFENLVETVKPLKPYIFDITKRNIIVKMKNKCYSKQEFLELNLKGNTKSDWEKSLTKFTVNYKSTLGFYDRVKSINNANRYTTASPLESEKTQNLRAISPYVYF